MTGPDTHSHDHDHDHARTFQPDIEDSAFSHYQVMAQALGEVLIDKGVITADELRGQLEWLDSRSPEEGAKLNRPGVQGTSAEGRQCRGGVDGHGCRRYSHPGGGEYAGGA